MFTGLIEEVGSVTAIGASKNGNQLKIAAPRIAKKIRRGDSLAVNGCCLTLNSRRGCERAPWWAFRSRTHRLRLAANHLPAEWHRLSIGNRVTGGICPLCRV